VWFEKIKNSLNLKFKPYNISWTGQTRKDFIQASEIHSELLFRHCSCYSDTGGVTTHPPVFVDATDPLGADSWLRTTESKFRLLHCTEYQNTLYVVQQLRGLAGAWWATYTTALPTDPNIP
jgi:hypothetical protein